MGLQKYHEKRKFNVTPEPKGKTVKRKAASAKTQKPLKFVIQEHHASHLHYDFRLEMEGVLRSWAVPKGPSTDPEVKRLAVEVEDHPLEYGSFEGVIPEDQYGAGHVILWDKGTWEPSGDAVKSFKKGRIDFELKGGKLHGRWLLVRTNRDSGSKHQWLLMKRHDDGAKKDSSAEKTSKKSKAASPDILSKREPLPRKLEPQLARLVDHTPDGDDWSHEIKLDGYRVMTRIEGKKVRLLTRSGLDWTEKFQSIQEAIAKLSLKDAILDGEIVVFDENGKSDFQALQTALSENRQKDLRYCIFDVPYLNGNNLMEWPLTKRREHLKPFLKKSGKIIRFSDSIIGNGKEFFKECCRLGLEGVISKRVDSHYTPGRGDEWVKSKCENRQEFVIGGFSDSTREGDAFASLLLGVQEKKGLRYVGKTGTGFTASSMKSILAKLRKLETDRAPFTNSPRERGLHWVKPKLVAEVNFASWTSGGSLRQASFQGLREDKAATKVVKETPKHMSEKKSLKTKSLKTKKKKADIKAEESSQKIELTHPDKILFKTAKVTKQELADYYTTIQKWILPHLVDRPLTIVRCPHGAGEKCFFQRHVGTSTTGNIREVKIGKDHGGNSERDYMWIHDMNGLRELVQIGSLELHTWNTDIEDLKHPKELIFDLDPAPGVSRKMIYECAMNLKKLLTQLKLKSFVNLSGNKGLHIHVPIARTYEWEDVKSFSHSVVRMMMERHPDLYTDNMRKKEREGKIFIDYLRNGFSSTSVVPYSVRNKPEATVAVPISWAELKPDFEPAAFDVRSTLKRLKRLKKDPWAGANKLEQKIQVLE